MLLFYKQLRTFLFCAFLCNILIKVMYEHWVLFDPEKIIHEAIGPTIQPKSNDWHLLIII